MVILMAGLFLLSACGAKVLNYPNEPEIELVSVRQVKSTKGKDSLVIVVFTFTDGDGDVGLSEEDTKPPFDFSSLYFHNLFVPLYKFEGGTFSMIPNIAQPVNPSDSFIHFNERLPNLTPEGRQRGIDGTITLTLSVNILPVIIANPPQQAKFTITLFDRKFNKSNTLETPILDFVW